jgi:hypothetical protein
VAKLFEKKVKGAEAEAKPSPTFFEGYGDIDPANTHVERQIDPDPPARPQHVTRPNSAWIGEQADGFHYNAIGLRSGPFQPSTHRAARDTSDIARKREEQESRAWRGFEYMLNLFDVKP